MAGPSSSTRSVLQDQLDELNELTVAELLKGKDCNEGLVAQYEKQVDILTAQIKLMASGEAQMRSVPCCQAFLASG